MILTPSQIRQVAHLPKDQNRTEVRLYAGAFTIIFMALLTFPALVLLTGVEDAPIYRVAALTHYPHAIGALFLLAALGGFPHLFFLIFYPGNSCQWPRQLVTGATSLASLTWCYLANLSDPLDMPTVTFIYWIEAFLCGGVGFLYGYSLNAQQIRLNEKPHIG